MRFFASLSFLSLFLSFTSAFAMLSPTIFDRSTRIAIIGAGAAGLNAAALLKENGYNNITIYEKSAEPFGKVRSEKIAHTLVEMGPVQIGVGHIYTNYWLNKLNLETFEPHHAYVLRSHDQEHAHRLFTPAEEFFPFKARIEILGEAWRLRNLIDEFFKLYPTHQDIPKDSDYMLSFADFCLKHKLPYFHKIYSIYTSAYGYGITNEIATFTVLRIFNNPLGALALVYGGINLKMITKGFGGLMQAIIDSYNLEDNIIYTQKITHINRDKNTITITSNNQQKKFDILIIACPIDSIYSSFKNHVSSDEQKLYEGLHYSIYHTIAADIDNLPRGGFVLPENFNKNGTLQMISKNSIGGDIAVLYVPQISSVKAKDIIEKRVELPSLSSSIYASRMALENLGFKMGVIHKGMTWNNYNPHFKNPALYELGNKIQGHNNTFYVGAMLSDIDFINDSFAHTHKIISKFFQGHFEKPEQSAAAIINWHFKAHDEYSLEQKENTPGPWLLTMKNLLRISN